MGKAVVIVPGKRESVAGNAYKKIGSLFEARLIKPIYIQPDWSLKSVKDMLNDTTSKISESLRNDYDEIYSFGFSMGAMFSLLASSQLAFHKSVLCSMSFFEEEIPYMGMMLKLFTKRIIYGGEDIFTYPKVAPEQRFLFVYGEKELKTISQSIVEARLKQYPGEVVIAKKAGHNISHAGYQKTLRFVIEQI